MNLDDLQAELARQDEALATAMNELKDLGDVQIQLPAAVLSEIDETCTVHASAGSLNPNYLTGVRA